MQAAEIVLVIDIARPSGKRLALAGAVLVLMVLAAVASWRVRENGLSPGLARPASGLKDLPARPEDIEAHGSQARSVLAPEDARARNAAVPFWTGRFSVARSFMFQGSTEDRARARECLAAAVLYEAGDDSVGQAAVAQVVLNRVRHPAFPGTVCGVVYQGAQRATGCQFTFTCDGSLRRQMPEAAWRRARELADRALAGRVDETVGLATHYHTDWVYPYWSPELNKLARVGTHLFFGWRGTWGGPGAFRREYRGNEAVSAIPMEPVVAEAPLYPGGSDIGGPAHILGLPQPKAELPADMGNVPLHGNRLRLVRPDGRAFGLLAPRGTASSNLISAARALCSRPGPCQVNAWGNEDDIPGEYPIPAGARGTMVFEYVSDGAGGKASSRFDCERFPSKDPEQCLKETARMPAELSGVRWKED